MDSIVIYDTIRIKVRSGTYSCDTNNGPFSVYLPLPNVEMDKSLDFEQSSDDNNKITVWGFFGGDYDCIIFGGKRGQRNLSLISKDGKWVCLYK